MFESIKNDKIVADLRALADQLQKINNDCAEANSTTIGKFSTELHNELSKVAGHVRDMVAAKIRHDEVSADVGEEV